MSQPATLSAILDRLPKMAIAFSGGLDSRFLAHSARLHGCQILLLHARGPHIPEKDSAYARQWAQKHGLPLIDLSHNPLDIAQARRNSPERCYFCKKILLQKIASSMPAGEGWTLCDGTQADDMKAYRPGLKAVREMAVISPLAEAGLGKEKIREAAKTAGLDFWDQPARPCLLTRLAYGMEASAEMLAAIAACEEDLAAIAQKYDGGCDYRVRLTPDPALQWSRPASAHLGEIKAILGHHGFANAKIIEKEPVSGFFDRRQSPIP